MLLLGQYSSAFPAVWSLSGRFHYYRVNGHLWFSKSVSDLRQNQIYTIRKPHTQDLLGCIIYCLFKVKHFITIIFYAQSTYCLDMASAPNIVIEGEST